MSSKLSKKPGVEFISVPKKDQQALAKHSNHTKWTGWGRLGTDRRKFHPRELPDDITVESFIRLDERLLKLPGGKDRGAAE